MNKDRAITYSLLAHIRNHGTLAEGPIDIFVPLLKRTLSKMNNDGIYKGKSLIEIKNVADSLYNIDFPIPAIRKILSQICNEVNTEEETHFIVYDDGGFSINKFTFSDFEEIIFKQTKEIEDIENLFKEFCESSELVINESDSIFKFIEKNKFTLSKYISSSNLKNGEDYTSEAQFIDFFKRIPSIYERIKNIYLGSIIASYIEYSPDEVKQEIELLFDTNFIVGLLDLNTPESTHTCRTLLKIAKKLGFKTRVLVDTIEETKSLLEAKANFFDKSFLQKKVNPEDVYNACDRRNLTRLDLERISDNLDSYINEYEINIIYETEKFRNEAKFSEEFKKFEQVRNTKKAALHDAMAILYIRKRRKNKIKEFEKVNAWFVNNSISVEGDNIFLRNGYQPETIKADDLLNILWLSSPKINKEIKGDDLAEIGLTSIVSLTLNKNLPKSQILREFDDNINKYAKEEISDTDIIRVATRITNKQLKNIEELNQLAEKDKEEFVRRLESEALKQKRIEESRIKKLDEFLRDISLQTEELKQAKNNFEEKSKGIDTIIYDKEKVDTKLINLESKLLNEQNRIRKMQREKWINNEIKKWRKKTWIELSIFISIFLISIVYLLHRNSWSIDETIKYAQSLESNFIYTGLFSLIMFLFTTITVNTLIKKYRDHSNIRNYTNGLEIPEEFEELKNPML